MAPSSASTWQQAPRSVSSTPAGAPPGNSDVPCEAGSRPTIEEFRSALQYFDTGSQNWVVGETTGRIAYFTRVRCR